MPRYAKGKPPGPGRPPGSRNRSTAWLDALGGEGIENVIRTVKQAAEGGNMQAASIMLARTWPNRRGRPVPLDLPEVRTAAGLVEAQAAVIAAMARGELSPDEAAAVASVLEAQRRAIETHDHEPRIRELEKEKDAAKAAASGKPRLPPMHELFGRDER
jgi:thioredoxin-like negative regulator of GroEL